MINKRIMAIAILPMIGLVFVVSQLVAITPATRPVDYWNMLKADMRPPLSTGIPVKCSFDLDGDGDVDQSDFGVYQTCLGKFTDPQCSKIDLERDGEIGEIEHVYFRLCETGPSIPADPICQTFLLEGEITKPVGQAVSYAPLRFIGTGLHKGRDFCTKADQWGRWSIRLPAGWTGYYTIVHKIDKYDQRAMGLYQIAVRDAGGEGIVTELPLAKTRFDDRGAGRRFASKTDKDADSGALDGEALSFIMAWDNAQRQKGRMLSKSEVFQVVYGVLGYRLPVVPKPKRRRGRAFRRFCVRCECNLSDLQEIVQYQGENYCPACEPFIEKRDVWAEEEAEWSS